MAAKHTPASFWRRVNTSKPDQCWEWQGSINSTGYGCLTYQNQPAVAHRVAAYLSNIIPSLQTPRSKTTKGFVLHKCDNRKCCNPNHLFVGNYSDNQKDCYAKKRRAQPKGSAHANAKLSPQQIKEIKARYALGVRQIDLAKRFKVSQTAISRVLIGRTYQCNKLR